MTLTDADIESETKTEPEPVLQTEPPSATLLSAMAATIGLELSAERAAALAIQAEPHFALLRALDDIAHPSSEPAAEFHLDVWRSAIDG